MAFTQSEKNKFLTRLSEIIEENLSDERFGVNELAREMGMSRSNLHRKLKAVKGVSISSLIRQARLERARELLEESSSNISEIAFEVGFGSVTYFTKCFHDRYGFPPGEIRKVEIAETSSAELHPVPECTGFRMKRVSLTLLFSIIVLFTVAILVLVIQSEGSKDLQAETSVAVLPFINMSEGEDYAYLGNAFTDEIIIALQKIESFDRVLSFSSTMQFEASRPSIPEIAERLNVNYLIEGSIQQYAGRIRVRVQIIRAKKEDHIWGEVYEQEYREPKDMLAIQSEIAQAVAGELQVRITPEEKQIIEKVPTSSTIAYEFYQKGRVEAVKFWRFNDAEAIETAEHLFRYALEYDSTFAFPYFEIGMGYFNLYERNPLKYAGFLDSVLYYSNKALYYDNQLELAYCLRGEYYRNTGQYKHALEEYEKAIEINSNLGWAHFCKGMAFYIENDFLHSIQNFNHAAQLSRGFERPGHLRMLGMAYNNAGFPEKCMEILDETLAITGNSMQFHTDLSLVHYSLTNYPAAIETAVHVYKADTTNTAVLDCLAGSFFGLRQYNEALPFCVRYMAEMKASDQFSFWAMPHIAYIYLQNGEKEKANYCTGLLADYMQPGKGFIDNYLQSQLSVLQGEYDKAIYYLTELSKQEKINIWERRVKDFPIYDTISSEPEFLRIADKIERKYNSQLAYSRLWLEERGLL